MLIMPPEKKNQKSKKTKGNTSAMSAGAKRPKTTPKKATARVPIHPVGTEVAAPVEVAAPLAEPLALDLSAITPARLAALSVSQFKHGAIFGPAGSGKTHLVREALKINPRWGLLTASTGVAASILGPDVPTMHSALGISDTDSAVRSYNKGTLTRNCRQIKKNYDRLVIDEMSMLNSQMFDIISKAAEEAGLGIVIVGDFLQLAPVPETDKRTGYQLPVSPVFESKCWKNFAGNTITLQTQYRHTNAEFLKGLNLLRAGKGYEAIEVLKSAGVKFVPMGMVTTQLTLQDIVDFQKPPFNLTTIVATNGKRALINNAHYEKLPGEEVAFNKSGWGNYQHHAEWSDQGKFPDSVNLKIGTRVMILRNLYSDDKDHKLIQTNGDMGVVTAISPIVLDDGVGGSVSGSVQVKRDDGSTVTVGMMRVDNGKKHVEIINGVRQTIVDRPATCGMSYMPLTPAWAVTVHKAQGLTIAHPTRVEMEDWFGNPGSVYVACSRVKNPEDLTLVHADNQLTKDGEILTFSRDEYEPGLSRYCKTNPKCKKWL